MRDGQRYSEAMQFGETGLVGGGGNSGFQALNLAAQFGARRIVLIGYDMTGSGSETHWYGRNEWPRANNPGPDQMTRWAKALDRAAVDFAARGIEVVNASPSSAIAGFRCMPLADVLQRWL
jgi:hypothetical protein